MFSPAASSCSTAVTNEKVFCSRVLAICDSLDKAREFYLVFESKAIPNIVMLFSDQNRDLTFRFSSLEPAEAKGIQTKPVAARRRIAGFVRVLFFYFYCYFY